jgi:hypothetical protein
MGSPPKQCGYCTLKCGIDDVDFTKEMNILPEDNKIFKVREKNVPLQSPPFYSRERRRRKFFHFIRVQFLQKPSSIQFGSLRMLPVIIPYQGQQEEGEIKLACEACKRYEFFSILLIYVDGKPNLRAKIYLHWYQAIDKFLREAYSKSGRQCIYPAQAGKPRQNLDG